MIWRSPVSQKVYRTNPDYFISSGNRQWKNIHIFMWKCDGLFTALMQQLGYICDQSDYVAETNRFALNKVTRAHVKFLTPLNARIIKTCSILASERGALIPASSPSLSRWLQAQRAGHRDGWACRRLSASQMARSVSRLTTRRGGTLTSGHDWIRQLSFASPQHLWTAWRNEGVVVLEHGRVCVCTFLYFYLFESQFQY